ncbi:hypothetical protein FRB93_004045 [Tulasnella sp. JGI-2019a]|nr:hypothetical protein FRB93_004045 [Tulasnella sp. JGI-2019a]
MTPLLLFHAAHTNPPAPAPPPDVHYLSYRGTYGYVITAKGTFVLSFRRTSIMTQILAQVPEEPSDSSSDQSSKSQDSGSLSHMYHHRSNHDVALTSIAYKPS